MPSFLRFALAAVLAAAASAAGAQQRPLSLTHLTAPAGIGEYEWGLSIDRIFARHSKWLRQRSQPTQGYLYNLRYTLENPGTWGALVINMDPVSPWLASKKQPPFESGLGKLELNEEALAADLDASWEVLAEPIQTVMRRFGVSGAYEKLKEVTRGKTVTAEAMHALIRSLEIPQAEKDRLLAMTPASYTGKATELARRA